MISPHIIPLIIPIDSEIKLNPIKTLLNHHQQSHKKPVNYSQAHLNKSQGFPAPPVVSFFSAKVLEERVRATGAIVAGRGGCVPLSRRLEWAGWYVNQSQVLGEYIYIYIWCVCVYIYIWYMIYDIYIYIYIYIMMYIYIQMIYVYIYDIWYLYIYIYDMCIYIYKYTRYVYIYDMYIYIYIYSYMYGLYRYVKYPNSYQVGSVSHSSIKFPHDIPVYKAMAVPSSYMGCHIWYGQPMLWELEVYLCHLQGLREYPHQIGYNMVQ